MQRKSHIAQILYYLSDSDNFWKFREDIADSGRSGQSPTPIWTRTTKASQPWQQQTPAPRYSIRARVGCSTACRHTSRSSSAPFLALGEELEIPEAEVIQRPQAVIEARLIRQVGPIFDGPTLGYESCLVAAKYDPERLGAAGQVISSYPGVSHNYRRDHDFNLWYSVAVLPGQSLAAEVDLLRCLSGAESTLLLPIARMFKLGVKLDMEETPADSRSSPPVATGGDAQLPCAIEIAAVRAFQEPFLVTARPFEGPTHLRRLRPVSQQARSAGNRGRRTAYDATQPAERIDRRWMSPTPAPPRSTTS